jgi:2Fe-2S ferredoxin
MPTVNFIDAHGATRTVDAPAGSTVMEIAVKHDVPGIVGECGGACACATCHVYVDDAWVEAVGAPTDMEKDMLDFAFDVREHSRLSCQIIIRPELDGLIVHTPARQG